MASGLENIETIESPFRRFVTTIGVFPTAFTDAMTYYECLAYLVKYLEDTVIPAVNQNAEALEEVQNLYIQLKSYVDNYFANLDVQEEINNKLDSMVQDGTLGALIGVYVDPVLEEISENIEAEISQQNTLIGNIENNVSNLSNEQTVLSERMDTFTNLSEGSTTGDAELADIRVGQDGITYASAGSAVRANDKISQDILLKNEMYLLDVITAKNGFPLSTNKWGNVNSNYKVKFIPVIGGDKYVLKVDSLSYYGFVTDVNEPTPVEGTDINYVTGTSRSAITTSTNFEAYGTVPNTATFMFIVTVNSTVNVNVAYFRINDHEYTTPNRLTFDKINASIVDKCKQNVSNIWVSGTITGSVGNPCTEAFNTLRRKLPYAIKYPFDTYIMGDDTLAYSLIILDNSLNIVSQTLYINGITKISKNTYFRVIVADKNDSSADISSLTNDYINQHINIYAKDFYDIIVNDNTLPTSWCALGDSITQGTYSYMNGDTPAAGVDKNRCWVNLVAKQNRYELDNKGVGGQGFLYPDPFNSRAGYQYIDTINFTDYNLVTLAYGINDWKGNQVVGDYTDSSENPNTVCGAMKHCIERIMDSNPKCKIVVILPLNAWGYTFSYGDKSTNYGLGYSFPNSGTLESFTQKLIEVCNYYGIEYVDMTHYSPINRENLPDILIDGVHPSLDGHKLIANNLKFKL